MTRLLVILLVAIGLGQGAVAQADEGLIVKPSAYPVGETVDRLETALESKGITVLARVDHAGNASTAGLELLPPSS